MTEPRNPFTSPELQSALRRITGQTQVEEISRQILKSVQFPPIFSDQQLASIRAAFNPVPPALAEGLSAALRGSITPPQSVAPMLQVMVPQLTMSDQTWRNLSAAIGFDTSGMSDALNALRSRPQYREQITESPVAQELLHEIVTPEDVEADVEARVDAIVASSAMTDRDAWAVALCVATPVILFFIWASVVYPEFADIATSSSEYFVALVVVLHDRLKRR